MLSDPASHRHLSLGATLYVPATRADLVEVANGQRYPDLRSMVFCTEDAVRADQVETAVSRIEAMLPALQPTSAWRFIRVRSPFVMGRLMAARGIGAIDGFVLPKVNARSIQAYLDLLTERDPFLLMPTLETVEAFDPAEMAALRHVLETDRVRGRVLAVRIGGNDLLNVLGVRRAPTRTIYDSPIGPTIAMLVATFAPHGFALTAPVFEGLAHSAVLREEVARDIEYGLIGKTAVHPAQVPLIESAYRVACADLDMAQAMLIPESPAVFRMHDTMCEGATHARWARMIMARAKIFGVAGGVASGRHAAGLSGEVA